MFNNFVNRHDFTGLIDLVRRAGPRELPRLARRGERRVEDAWRHAAEEAPPENWWDIPAVRRRWNRLISGDEQKDHRAYIHERHLAGRGPLHGLSLGCGSGRNELGWAAIGAFERLDAFDISRPRIEYARRTAAEGGLDEVLTFEVGNVRDIDPPRGSYEVVLAEGSLHHFSPLEGVLERIDEWLLSGGLLIVNEYVGPARFQWTDRQVEAINGLLAILPPGRKRRRDGRIKRPVFRPSRLGMMLIDPSEAVESDRILPLLRERFEVLELRPFGGTILHMLFSGIAHNFLDEGEQTQSLLDLCFGVEDLLLGSGELESDFAVAVCRKRDRSPGCSRAAPSAVAPGGP